MLFSGLKSFHVFSHMRLSGKGCFMVFHEHFYFDYLHLQSHCVNCVNCSLEIEINSSVSPQQVFSTSLCGVFYFPWHRHQEEVTNDFLVTLPKDTGNVG